jgi:hypothetical protein
MFDFLKPKKKDGTLLMTIEFRDPPSARVNYHVPINTINPRAIMLAHSLSERFIKEWDEKISKIDDVETARWNELSHKYSSQGEYFPVSRVMDEMFCKKAAVVEDPRDVQ